MSDIPPGWFVDALHELATQAAIHSMVKRPIVTILVDQDFGLQLGIPPGSWMDIMTPMSGYVRIKSQRTFEKAP